MAALSWISGVSHQPGLGTNCTGYSCEWGQSEHWAGSQKARFLLSVLSPCHVTPLEQSAHSPGPQFPCLRLGPVYPPPAYLKDYGEKIM